MQYRVDNGLADVQSSLISAVIPSRQRPALLLAAVQSVLLQGRNDLEVIVVLDGDTAGSAEALGQAFPGHPQIRVLENATQAGVSAARNRGVQAARGKWIALLDDDDEWLPGKLEKQMTRALASRFPEPVVTCQIRRDTGRPHPQHPPVRPMSEYLFVRKFFGEAGWVQTSTILAPRSLFLRVPFTEGLRKHEDMEWALRVSQEATVGFEFVAEPLATYDNQPGRERLTDFYDWQYSMAFARSRRALMTRKGYAAFVLSRCNHAAARRGHWGAVIPIFAEAMRHGSPSITDVFVGLRFWLGRLGLGPVLRRIRMSTRRNSISDTR